MSDQKLKKVAVIVVTYNGIKWIDKCLKSLKYSTYSLHTIVLDNNSNDGTIEKIEKDYTNVELIKSKKNNGFGSANNIGIKKALENDYDYIFLLNQDAWVEPDAIRKLIDIAENYDEFGILSPMHLNSKGSALDFHFSTYLDPKQCPGLISDIYLDQSKDIYPLLTVNAAAWLVRDCVFKTVGYFDELYFMYGEDDNFIDRTQYHGYEVGVVPEAQIFHARNERAKAELPARLDKKKQSKRALVNAMHPNKTLIKKIVYQIRKSFSDILINIQEKEWSAVAGNFQNLFKGSIFIVRYDKRHK